MDNYAPCDQTNCQRAHRILPRDFAFYLCVVFIRRTPRAPRLRLILKETLEFE